jgi:hypothetical protein
MAVPICIWYTVMKKVKKVFFFVNKTYINDMKVLKKPNTHSSPSISIIATQAIQSCALTTISALMVSAFRLA